MRHRAPRQARRWLPAAALLSTIAGLLVSPAAGTSAAWTDQAAVTGTQLTAHSVAPPGSTSCTEGALNVTIAWPEKDARYDYEVVLKRANGDVVSTRQVTGAGLGTTYGGTDFDLGILAVGQYDFTVEVRSYLASSPSWRSVSVHVADQTIRVTVVLQVLVPILQGVDCV